MSEGRLWGGAHHRARLARDAERLGLGKPDAARIEATVATLLEAAAAGSEAAMRIELRAGGAGGAPELLASLRTIASDTRPWRAVVAPWPHPGAPCALGAKCTERRLLDAAGEWARRRGCEEALLFDRSGRLVEGARTNLFVVLGDEGVLTPPLGRGAVAGLARAVVLERVAEAREADLGASDLASAREIVAVSAVRGAQPLVALGGRAVGSGRAGPWAARLGAALVAAGLVPPRAQDPASGREA